MLVNLYGSTETGIVSMATPEDLLDEPTTLGRPGIGISVRILRDDRSIADVGERGTIFMRGGLLFEGYTADGDDTPAAKEVVDGHVNTGDMGHLDDQGRLYVDGRDDDMVVSGGENVFPLEVEQALGRASVRRRSGGDGRRPRGVRPGAARLRHGDVRRAAEGHRAA